MKGPVKALHRILVYTTLLVVDTRASDDSQMIGVDHIYDKPMSPLIQDEDMNLLLKLLDNPLDNSVSFELTQTEKIKTAHYACSPSSSTEIHNYDTDLPKEYTELIPYTEQTYPLPSFYSTLCEPSKEHPPVCYIPNEPAKKDAESVSLSNYKQPSKTKRPRQAIEESTARKKQNKANESGLNSDSTDNNKLNSSRIHKTKKNIGTWNNSKLKNRHRESLHLGYKPAIVFDRVGRNKYKEIGDEKHQSLIKTHAKRCKAAYSKIPVQNELWFFIASRSTSMHIKHADCKAMNANPSKYKFIEGLSGYYPGLPGDIVRYMDKHRPIFSDQKSIKTEWKEAIGDIYVREPIESEYGIDEETITVEICKEYRAIHTAVQTILRLPEVHKDLSTITFELVEKTLKDKRDSNHLAIVEALQKIVEKHKSSNKLEIDEEYVVFCYVFRNILHRIDASYESMVIRLYTEMYKSLVYFYEKTEVCDKVLENKRKKKNGEKEYYLLAGKCIIKPQRYLKCTATIDLNKKDISENKHQIAEEMNRWSIPSDIHSHYHIHYVDNTKQQYTRVCMPMCLDESIHTISQTIDYLKKIYNIEKEECICPYKRDQFYYWEYIQKKDRNKTVNEFTNCDIVFYYIEEGLRDDYFTFAEFESYVQPEGKTARIPLFLSPLMRSAVSMGPFEEADKIKHTVVDSMQYTWMKPDVYTYKEKYKEIEHSHVYYYYSNLYIRRDSADVQTIDCYIMDSKTIISNGTATVEWYAKIPSSVDEYTHCILSDELMNDRGKYNALRKAVRSQEYTLGSVLHGFCLQSSLKKTSEFNDMRCITDDSVDQKDIANCKLSIVPIHKTPANPIIAYQQSKIDKLDKEVKQIKKTMKDPGITKKQKKELGQKRNNTNWAKHRNIQKINKIQLKDRLHVKEYDITLFPSCAFFLVFRHSDTQTKSSLGAHNEILDALTRIYNNPMFLG